MSNTVLVALLSSEQKPTQFMNDCAKALKKELYRFHCACFADGESYTAPFEGCSLKDKAVIGLAQFSFGGGSNLNATLFELFGAIRALRELGAQKITLLLPYLPYARHDVSLVTGGIGFIELLVRLFKEAGVDELVTLDVHQPSIVSNVALPLKEISLAPFWTAMLPRYFPDIATSNDYVIASPDKGGVARAGAVATLLKKECVTLTKERYAPDKTRPLSLQGDVRGKKVIMIDDIIDTAHTAFNAAQLLLQKGAHSVVGCFSHGIIAGNAKERLQKASFSKIMMTDTVVHNEMMPKIIETLSVGTFFAQKIS